MRVTALLLGWLLATACQAPSAVEVEEQQVYLVRHAEKAAEQGDPELNAAGVKRAAALAERLGDAGVTHLFSSPYRRTRATLAPLAERLGLTIEEVSAREPDELCRRISALPASAVVVVAGHSNTVPDLVRRLAGVLPHGADGQPVEQLAHLEYDRLFLVTRTPDGARACLAEMRFGAASPAAP